MPFQKFQSQKVQNELLVTKSGGSCFGPETCSDTNRHPAPSVQTIILKSGHPGVLEILQIYLNRYIFMHIIPSRKRLLVQIKKHFLAQQISNLAMAEHVAYLFTKIILPSDADFSALLGPVTLEIDYAYTIGKSIAVMRNDSIMGHLERSAARVVWRFLRANSKIKADVYATFCGRKNEPWYSILTHSYEIGVQISFHLASREDAKLLLAHISRRRLNVFPGVSVLSCPENLKPLVCPVKDENGLSSVLLACLQG